MPRGVFARLKRCFVTSFTRDDRDEQFEGRAEVKFALGVRVHLFEEFNCFDIFRVHGAIMTHYTGVCN